METVSLQYSPFQSCITDSAVCERYMLLPNDKKQMIAGELDREVREIERKISVSSRISSIRSSPNTIRIYVIVLPTDILMQSAL